VLWRAAGQKSTLAPPMPRDEGQESTPTLSKRGSGGQISASAPPMPRDEGQESAPTLAKRRNGGQISASALAMQRGEGQESAPTLAKRGNGGQISASALSMPRGEGQVLNLLMDWDTHRLLNLTTMAYLRHTLSLLLPDRQHAACLYSPPILLPTVSPPHAPPQIRSPPLSPFTPSLSR